MKINFQHHGVRFSCVTNATKSLAIELNFQGPQPNHFGTEKATSNVLKLGGFTGSTEAGGSCNVETLKMVPHCNGTHTETVSHIVNEDIWVGHAAMDVFHVALVITLVPRPAKDSTETYRPKLDDSDLIITAQQVQESIESAKLGRVKLDALIVRTLPNSIEKCARAYSDKNCPPFFTVEAMEEINRLRIRHLLVDFPSVDRMYDDGLLTNHHLYWKVDEGTHELSASTEQEKTITEMIFVEDEIDDGLYALNIQVPSFSSDAAPSRPVIMPLEIITE